jgi:hypothetical protein
LGLLSDLCPTESPRYVEHVPIYIPPSPPFPSPTACYPTCGAPMIGCGSGAVGAPIQIHTNCGLCGNCVVAQAPARVVVEPCIVATQATVAKVYIIAAPSSDELEMNAGGTCIRCKKMTVTIGENEIALSRFDDRVRVRGEELKATAASVRSDNKDRLILEGDVVLHYKKDGHSANVTGDRIELNLCSGAVTIKPAAKTPSTSAVHIDHIDTDSK